MNSCLDKITNGKYEATTCFNMITNDFDLFFNTETVNIPNDLSRNNALSIMELLGYGHPPEVKKFLG